MDKLNMLTEPSKPEYFEKLKKRQNYIWQDWWYINSISSIF